MARRTTRRVIRGGSSGENVVRLLESPQTRSRSRSSPRPAYRIKRALESHRDELKGRLGNTSCIHKAFPRVNKEKTKYVIIVADSEIQDDLEEQTVVMITIQPYEQNPISITERTISIANLVDKEGILPEMKPMPAKSRRLMLQMLQRVLDIQKCD